VIWANPAEGVLVTRYLPGPAWTEIDIHDTQNLQSLAALLRRLHDLPAQGQEFDPSAAANNYARIIDTQESASLASKTNKLAAELHAEQFQSSLCHNDLVHMNIVGMDPVRLIDWEYAALGDPLFDLAVVVRHHNLCASVAAGFLQAWLPAHGKSTAERFQAFCLLYDMLSELWYQATRAESARD
jgi:thiamine kinase